MQRSFAGAAALSRVIVSGCLVLAGFGCGSSEETPSGARATSAPSSPTGEAASTVQIRPTTLSWKAPPSFQLVPSPSPMRLATYKITKAEGDPADGEMTVSQVGGGAANNIERWKNQFDGPTVREETEVTVGDLKVTVIWIEGSFKGMSMPGMPANTAKEGYGLLGAAVSKPGQDEHYFKLTGPKKTVESVRPAFDELVQSFAPRG